LAASGRELVAAFIESCRWIAASRGVNGKDRFRRLSLFAATPANGR